MEKKISVVVPMYNEEAVARVCFERLTKTFSELSYDYELIFVNDGSRDGTLGILKEIAKEDAHAKVVSFSRNFGHQNAVSAGIDYATGDAVVLIDADLQDPPELIPNMISSWEKGWDVVYATRKARKGESAFKRGTAKLFYRVLNALSDTEIPKDTGDFRLMDKKVVEALKQMPEQNRFIRGMVSWVGFKQLPMEYERDERLAGETKYPFKKMIKFAADGITAFSLKPLKLMIGLGTLAVLLAAGIVIYSVIQRWLFPEHVIRGWASIMVAVSFFSGVQLLSLGVIGQYLGRTYDEARKRPLYLVDELVNF